jgi:hypothetical protein
VLVEAQPLEQLVRAPARERARLVVEPPDELEVRPGAEQAVDGRGLPGEPNSRAHRGGVRYDVEAIDARGAGRRPGECGEDADGRRLPRAVVAEETQDGSGGHLQIEVL